MTRSANPFRYFDSSPEVIRLVVMMSMPPPSGLLAMTVSELAECPLWVESGLWLRAR